jgi:hypothetical protein
MILSMRIPGPKTVLRLPCGPRISGETASRNEGACQATGLRDGRAKQTLAGLFRAPLVVAGLCLFIAAGLGTAHGQQRKPRVPGLGRISGGSTRQAFSGVVQSLDMKHSILNVNTVEGGVTEIFPIKKNTDVVTADGDKLKLKDLKSGTNVLIYYTQKGDRRTVKQIVVLAGEPAPAKKPAPHS